MNEKDLLNALIQVDPGIECLISSRCATVTTLYKPCLRGLSQSLFSAAYEVAELLWNHPDCPLEVKEALIRCGFEG